MVNAEKMRLFQKSKPEYKCGANELSSIRMAYWELKGEHHSLNSRCNKAESDNPQHKSERPKNIKRMRWGKSVKWKVLIVRGPGDSFHFLQVGAPWSQIERKGKNK